MFGSELSGAIGSQNTVYKVVDARLGSVLARGNFYVHYRPGEFVRAPEGTKFFVFKSLEYAVDFLRKKVYLQVWKATARGLDVPPSRIGDPTHSIDMLDFWQTNNRGKSYGMFAGYPTPPGTLWADELRLDEYIIAQDVMPVTSELVFHARLRP